MIRIDPNELPLAPLASSVPSVPLPRPRMVSRWRRLLSRHALALAADLASRTQTLRVATTRTEREALYRFRYDTYVGERNRRRYPGVNHRERMIEQADDEAPNTTHLYLGTPKNIRACVKIRDWAPGRVPAEQRRQYRLEVFPELEQLHLCDTTQLMVRPDLRGSATMLFLTLRAGHYACRELGVEAALADCSPGLVGHYQRLGFRDFGAPLVSADVVLVPLVFLVGDLAYSRKTGALWHHGARRGLRSRGLPERSEGPIAASLALRERLSVSPRRLRDAIASSPVATLAALSPAARDWLLDRALVLEIEAGARLTTRGIREHELYLALSGHWIRDEGDTCERLGPGALLGAEGLCTPERRRLADIHAQTDGHVLVLRESKLRPRDDAPPHVHEAQRFLHALLER